MNRILRALTEHQFVMSQMEMFIPLIEKAANQITDAIKKGGKILWMGNGGSAADAQHFAAELIGRFMKERRALPSLALTTDSSVLTALSNDYDYSIIFSRQIEALCKPNDVVVGISTSGNSPNILLAIEAAKKIGAYTIGLSGKMGELLAKVDLAFSVPSTETARIQEAHLFIGHSICELVEELQCTPIKLEDACV